MGSDVATCPQAPEWVPALPRAPSSRTRFPAGMGSGVVTCPSAPDPASRSGKAPPDLASLLRWAPASPRVLRLWTPPLDRGRLWCYSCPTVPYGLRDSYIKKGIADLPAHLGLRVHKAHMFTRYPHVFSRCARVFPRRMTSEPLKPARCVERRHHHGLQDVRTCSYSAAPALLTTRKAQLQCGATQQDNTIPLTVHDMANRLNRACPAPRHHSLLLAVITLRYMVSTTRGHQSGPETQCN
jgi:hypothetical protein